MAEHSAPIPWPDPTPEMLTDPRFEAIWQAIKTWDINVPGAYGGYCGATGNHVRAILDALTAERDRLRAALERIATWRDMAYHVADVAETARAALAATPPPDR